VPLVFLEEWESEHAGLGVETRAFVREERVDLLSLGVGEGVY